MSYVMILKICIFNVSKLLCLQTHYDCDRYLKRTSYLEITFYIGIETWGFSSNKKLEDYAKWEKSRMSHAYYYELKAVKAPQEHGGIWYDQTLQVVILWVSKAREI